MTEKIEVTQANMAAAQASANNETKSSAGDKYETGRAMGQRERDLHARQFSELLNKQKIFLNINVEKAYETVELGSVVQTASGWFFISASFGVIDLDGQPIMAISAIAPISQAMLGKKQGDQFDWMKKRQEILAVY